MEILIKGTLFYGVTIVTKRNSAPLLNIFSELGEIFSKKDYEQAKEKAIKLRYLAKIQEEIIGKVGYHI